MYTIQIMYIFLVVYLKNLITNVQIIYYYYWFIIY